MSKEKILVELLGSRTNKELIEGWEMVSKMPMSEEIPIIRDWYMEEIEKRFPKEFDEWLESETCEDEELRKYLNL